MANEQPLPTANAENQMKKQSSATPNTQIKSSTIYPPEGQPKSGTRPAQQPPKP